MLFILTFYDMVFDTTDNKDVLTRAYHAYTRPFHTTTTRSLMGVAFSMINSNRLCRKIHCARNELQGLRDCWQALHQHIDSELQSCGITCTQLM